jgi:hypothetical protein
MKVAILKKKEKEKGQCIKPRKMICYLGFSNIRKIKKPLMKKSSNVTKVQ